MTSRPDGHNRLAEETSPYLLQHAANPVDWHPWGDEAFEIARAKDRPVLLSIGYSSCHWCHVMAHESFEDAATAEIMNALFVNIKVDREERPDVDSVYMKATQVLTGQGGWPNTVFLTPERKPFYAGTYFPPRESYGRPSFTTVLRSVHDAWLKSRDRILNSADEITRRLHAVGAHSQVETAELDPTAPDRALSVIRQTFDKQWGGFGDAPKFPAPGVIEFLLASHSRTGSTDLTEIGALSMATLTLRKMAQGGMYDQLGGGFSRYSVDSRWLVPHFEKMLYDNAQLARVYLHAYQVTNEPFYERIARETLDYLVREMLDDGGGFYSAQDADSEGIEGKYFVWTPAEIEELVGREEAALVNAFHGVTEAGNFADPHHPEFGRRNVLSAPAPIEEVADDLGIEPGPMQSRLSAARDRLLAEREKRVKPGRDDKILTSWNGLALAAFAEAFRVLRDEKYRVTAERNAAYVQAQLWQNGRFHHVYTAGVAKVDAMLEDYSYYGLGLIELYKATGDLDHLEAARHMFENIMERFHDSNDGGFFDTAHDAESLILREKSYFDGPTPSGNGATITLAVWLGRYYAKPEWETVAAEVVRQVQRQVIQAPTGFGSVLTATEIILSPHREIAIVGEQPARKPLEEIVAKRFLPSTVIAPSSAGGGLPILQDRDSGTGAVAYVCENMACRLPARTAEELSLRLDEAHGQ